MRHHQSQMLCRCDEVQTSAEQQRSTITQPALTIKLVSNVVSIHVFSIAIASSHKGKGI